MLAYQYYDGHQISVPGGPQVNNFEQVSSLGHKMSEPVAGGPQVKNFEEVSSVGHQMSLAGAFVQKGTRAGVTVQ